MQPLDDLQHNKAAWDRLAKTGNRFARPANEDDLQNPLASVDGPGWLGKSKAGKKVLCLAAGGSKQGPNYAGAGAEVTVVDISSEMLEIDNQVANKFGLNVRTIQASMDDLSMLGDAIFDIVIQPVSTCYLSQLGNLFPEIARVTTVGGIYISQHKQPTSLQTSIRPGADGYVIESTIDRTDPLPDAKISNLVREPGTLEFVHSLQAILGGICHAGFSIRDLIEPQHGDVAANAGTFEHRSRFVNPYLRIKAVRDGNGQGNFNNPATKRIWSPGS